MSVKKINIVEDNTAPAIVLTLKRDGVVIDVTGCTVRLIIVKGSTITNATHQECTLVVAASGIVQYTPQANDFPSAGNYKADVEIEYAPTSIERLYDQLKIKARKKLG
jgi:Ethanolamine utilization protein EutJ (predicted chaperonin)